MRRILAAFVLVCAVLSSLAPLAAQENLRFRARFASVGLPTAVAPIISITTPTGEPTLETTASTLNIGGIASDNLGLKSITWACPQCTPTSGGATGLTTWAVTAAAGSSTVVEDNYAPTGANVDVTTRNATPTGGAYTEDIDTSAGGTAYVLMRNAEGAVRPSIGIADGQVGVKIAAAPSGTNYTASAVSYANGGQFRGIRFGGVDASNYCVLGWFHITTVYVVEVVAGVATDRITIPTTVVDGDVLLIDVNGTALTVKKNGATIGSGTSTVCDNGTVIGLVWGNVRNPSDNASGGDLIDNLTVVDRGASAAGITLATGTNVITVTATDTNNNTATDVLTVTKSASDTLSPSALITQPTPNPTDTVTATAYTVQGTCTDNVACTSVTWACPQCTVTSGTATGTDTWTFNLTLGCSAGGTANVITVTPADAAANAPITDVLTTTCSNADVTPPTVTITAPTSGTTYDAGTAASIAMGGTAADTGGSGLASVLCINDQGTTVAAAGTANWTCTVALTVGPNTVRARAADGAGTTTDDILTVTRTAATLTLTTASLPTLVQNTAYAPAFCLGVSGGTGPYTYALQSGTLPTGITQTGSTACWAGTPTNTGTFASLIFRVTDSLMATDDSAALSITVNAAGAAGPHSYFDARVASGVTLNSNSLRSQDLIDKARSGEDSTAPVADNLGVKYVFSTDPDPNKQDAAKVTIPAWFATTATLAQNITDTTSTTIYLTDATVAANNGGLKIDSEYFHVVAGSQNYTLNTVQVVRGSYASTAATHTLGAAVWRAGNSLDTTGLGQPRPDLGVWGTWTTDGNTYLLTWDTFNTSSYLNTGMQDYKAFQIDSFKDSGGGSPAIWLEPQFQQDGTYNGGVVAACFDPAVHVYSQNLRSYNTVNALTPWAVAGHNAAAPEVTNTGQVLPRAAEFCAKANEWVRWWVRVEQRADDWDYVTMWMASESAAAVKVYDNLGFSIRVRSTDGKSAMLQWWIEMNTSDASYQYPGRGDTDLVMYVRNFWVGESAGLASAGAFSDANMTALLVQPLR